MHEPFLKSVRDALAGIRIAWQEERNFRIETTLALIAIAFAFVFGFSRGEWLILTLTIIAVLSVELLNTALEEFCDMVRKERDPHIGKIKDLAAGAVLIAALGAFAVSLYLYVPHVIAFFS